MSKDIVKTINGIKFYFRILDFQGDNKRFYITYHEDSSLENFDITINKRWLDSVGMHEVMDNIKIVFNNPKRSTKKTIGEFWRIKKKLNYYEKKEIENIAERKIKSISDIENIIVEKFRGLNALGQVRALEYLEDLIGISKYRALNMKKVSN